MLVVDDEPDLRDLLRVCLTMDGHDVEVAPDGLRGLEAARRTHPEVVLLDVMMPVMDGWRTLSALKDDDDPDVAVIPVVMLTARAEDMDTIRGGIEGAVRYLTKPFSIEELRRAVHEAVAGGPEPAQRKAAQQAALVHLAKLERGAAPGQVGAAKPRMSRLEPVSGAHRAVATTPAARQWPTWLNAEILTVRDQEILQAVVSAGSLTEARLRLGVSRSYLYARVRRMAGRLDFQSGPALVQALRVAHASSEREARPSGRAPSGA